MIWKLATCSTKYTAYMYVVYILRIFHVNMNTRSPLTNDIVKWSQYITCHYWFINSLRPSDAYMRRQTNQHWTAPSHYLNQCWNIVNWTLRNKLQWNFNRNEYIFIRENPLENFVCEMASILSRPQCDNHFIPLRDVLQILQRNVSRKTEQAKIRSKY